MTGQPKVYLPSIHLINYLSFELLTAGRYGPLDFTGRMPGISRNISVQEINKSQHSTHGIKALAEMSKTRRRAEMIISLDQISRYVATDYTELNTVSPAEIADQLVRTSVDRLADGLPSPDTGRQQSCSVT